MNGRFFDPYLARFLSPDPILENNGNSQAFNRYSYCYNNPLKYTDPSGYKPVFDPSEQPPWNVWNPGFGPGGSTSSWRPPNDAIFFFSSQSAFINTYGSKAYNQLYFSNITLPSILSNSEFNLNLSGSKAEDFFAALQAGFSLSSVQAFGRTTYVLSLGDLGKMTLSNGGVKFSNPTSGEYLSGPNIIGGGFNFDNSNLALDIGGGIYGGLRTAVTPGDQWLGKNGKYSNNSWGGNRFTGSRSGAFAASNTYKWAGRAAVGFTAIIGGIAVYIGYQMDGGQFGYNANIAGATATGGIIGGWAGAQAGAYGFGIAGGLIGGPPGAVVGAVIGGFVGGFWGGRLGSYMGESSVNYYYGR